MKSSNDWLWCERRLRPTQRSGQTLLDELVVKQLFAQRIAV